MIVVVLLSFLTFLAALALSDRARGRGEQAVEVWLFWVGIVVGLVYALGIAGVLTRTSLGLSALGVDAAVLGVSFARGRRKGQAGARAFLRELWGIVRIPIDLLVASFRSKSLLALIVPMFFLLVAWLMLQAMLAPTWKDWDSLWYHEAMTGFAIQNHGFKTVELPLGLQRINGFQRLCEATQLWFAIFAGRKLIDVANLATLPLLLATVYAFARRHRADVATAAGWAIALAVVPANLRLMQSTMIDPEVAALLMCAAYFVSRPELTRRAAICAALALTLAVGAKVNTIPTAFLLTLWFLVRLFAARRAIGGLRALAIGIVAGLGELAMIAFTHLKNWLVFGNPFYPIVNYDNPRLGIHWVGESAVQGDNVLGAIDVNVPVATMIERLYSRPYTQFAGGPTWQVHDTGFAYAFVVVPLALFCLVVSLFYLLWKLVRRKDVDQRRLARSAFFVAFIGFLSWVTSPAAFAMRYNIAPIGMLMIAIVWLSGLDGFRKIGDAVVVFASIGSLIMAYWASPHWVVDFKTMMAMTQTSPARRECSPEFGAPTSRDVCLAREREVTAGKVFAFVDTPFNAIFWNHDFSNKAVFLSDPEHPLEQAERIDATWIHARYGSVLQRQAASSDHWSRVGTLEAEPFGEVYRRR